MGYSYRSSALTCDKCGATSGTRKRTCAYRVNGVPYCPPPALCSDCYRSEGGLRGVHGARCRDGAAKIQAEDDARTARLAAGDLLVTCAWGSWAEWVPDGHTGVDFSGRGKQVRVLMRAEDYDYAKSYRDHEDVGVVMTLVAG